MKVRKCIRVLLMVLLFVLLSIGCAKAGHLGEKTSNGGENIAKTMSGENSEMKYIGGGETITLTDGQEIASAVARMEQFDVVRSEDTDIKAPGAASICVIFQYTNDTEKRITFPCFTVDGVTYKALCDGEGVYYQQLEPVVHWPFYQEEEP